MEQYFDTCIFNTSIMKICRISEPHCIGSWGSGKKIATLSLHSTSFFDKFMHIYDFWKKSLACHTHKLLTLWVKPNPPEFFFTKKKRKFTLTFCERLNLDDKGKESGSDCSHWVMEQNKEGELLSKGIYQAKINLSVFCWRKKNISVFH